MQHPTKDDSKIAHVELSDNSDGTLLLGHLDTPGSTLVGNNGLVSAEAAAELQSPKMDIRLTLTAKSNAQAFCSSSTTQSANFCAVGALMDGIISQKPMPVLVRGNFLSALHKIGPNGHVTFGIGGDNTVNFGIDILVNALYEDGSPEREIASQWRRSACTRV